MKKTFLSIFTKFLVLVLMLSASAIALVSSPHPAKADVLTPYVWVPSHDPTHTLTKLSTATGAVLATYDLPAEGVYSPSLAIDMEGNVWVSNLYVQGILKINGETGAQIGTYDQDNYAIAVAADASGNIWVVHPDSVSYTVSKLNASTGALIGTYSLGDPPLVPQNSPVGVTADASGNIWVVHTLEYILIKLNGATGELIGTYNMPGEDPMFLAVDEEGNIWVTSNVGVIKFNGATGDIIDIYDVGSVPKGIAVDGSGNIWVTNSNENTVTKLNGTTGDTIGTYDVGDSPWAVASDADGNIWVVNSNDGTVTKLNGATGDTIGTYENVGLTGFLGDFTGFALQTFVLGGGTPEELESHGGVTAPSFGNLPNDSRPINLDEGQTITDPLYTINVLPEGKKDITKVEFYVDDTLICTDTEADSNGVYSCDWDTTKYHSTVKIIAYNSDGETTTLTRNVTVNTTLPQTGADFQGLFNRILNKIAQGCNFS